MAHPAPDPLTWDNRHERKGGFISHDEKSYRVESVAIVTTNYRPPAISTLPTIKTLPTTIGYDIWRADDVDLDQQAVHEMYMRLGEPVNWSNPVKKKEVLDGNRDPNSWKVLIEETLGGHLWFDTNLEPGFWHVLITLKTDKFSVMLPLQVRGGPWNLMYDTKIFCGITAKLGTLNMVQEWLEYSCHLVSSADWIKLIVLACEWQKLLHAQDNLIRSAGMQMLKEPWKSYSFGQQLPPFGMIIEDVKISVDHTWMVKKLQGILKTMVNLRTHGFLRDGEVNTIKRLSAWILKPDQYPEFWSNLQCGPKEWKFILQNSIVFDLLVLFIHKNLPVEVMLRIIAHVSPNVTGKEYETLVHALVEEQQAAVC